MSGESGLPRELLRDSEATLRLVDSLLGELHATQSEDACEN
jgi:hypothetical protein